MENAQISILIIDDDYDDIDLFREALGEVDHTVQCVGENDARLAVAKLADGQLAVPSLIFLDVNMPIVTGWEILERLKTIERIKSVPVIMYSTSSLKRDIDKAKDLGAACFIVKPCLYTELIKQVADIIKNVRKGGIYA